MNYRQKKLMVNCLLVLVAILLFFNIHKIVQDINNGTFDMAFFMRLIEFVSIILTVAVAVWQLVDSKEIARATFIKELNQSYVDNPDYMKVYNMLQNCFDKTCEYHPDNGVCTNCKMNIEKGVVSNYLTFFETIYILKKRRVINFKVIDDLFAYRFFLAVHSEYFQKSKLEPQPNNFKNIFKLEKEWLDYRVSVGKNNQADLDKALNRFIESRKKNEATVSWDNVYEDRQLRGLVDEEKYRELIK